MEEIAEAQAEAEPEETLTPEERAQKEMVEAVLAKMRAADRYSVVPNQKKPRVDIPVAIARLCEKPEDFYFELFSRIKTLAQANISYGDTHVGNILPNPKTDKGVQLIDFDGANEHKEERDAAAKSLESAYTMVHFREFVQLTELSTESQALIQYFRV